MLVQENAASLKIIKKRNDAIEHHSSFFAGIRTTI